MACAPPWGRPWPGRAGRPTASTRQPSSRRAGRSGGRTSQWVGQTDSTTTWVWLLMSFITVARKNRKGGVWWCTTRDLWQQKSRSERVNQRILNSNTKISHRGKSHDVSGKLLRECVKWFSACSRSLQHENLVRLLGLVIEEGAGNGSRSKIFLVTEFMGKGSLLEYLRSRGRQFVTKKDQIGFAYDTCCGMAYLESRHVVHRSVVIKNVAIFSSLSLFPGTWRPGMCCWLMMVRPRWRTSGWPRQTAPLSRVGSCPSSGQRPRSVYTQIRVYSRQEVDPWHTSEKRYSGCQVRMS